MPAPIFGTTPSGSYYSSTVGFEGLTSFAAEVTYRGLWARQKSYSVAVAFGKDLMTAVANHADGRPGPNRVTGEYIDSLAFEVTSGGAGTPVGATMVAGTDEPYAMRLELGFTGVDSLGRVYDQPPFPHWGPAWDEVYPRYEELMTAIVDFDKVPD